MNCFLMNFCGILHLCSDILSIVWLEINIFIANYMYAYVFSCVCMSFFKDLCVHACDFSMFYMFFF